MYLFICVLDGEHIMHNELCPMSELPENCFYVKSTGHHLREYYCAYCQRDCECDLIEKVLDKAGQRVWREMHGIPMHLFDGVVDVDTFTDAWEIATNYAIDAIHKSGEPIVRTVETSSPLVPRIRIADGMAIRGEGESK
jgi:hypothetical protein